jgi:hypothetical protein
LAITHKVFLSLSDDFDILFLFINDIPFVVKSGCGSFFFVQTYFKLSELIPLSSVTVTFIPTTLPQPELLSGS